MELYFLPSTFTSLDASSGEEMFPVTKQFSDYQLTCQDMYDWGGEIMVIKWGIVTKKNFLCNSH